jgi:hypothetical protein
MKPISKIIIGLTGVAVIGLVTYFYVSNNLDSNVSNKAVTDPEKDTVATALVIKDTVPEIITSALGVDGEEFTKTKVDGVYANASNDKLIIVKEDIWNKMLKKIQKKLPHLAEDCAYEYKNLDLEEFKFVGLLTYLATSENSKTTTAYEATEIRSGDSKTIAGGDICCDCEGEPLVPQQLDVVIDK